MPDDMAGRPETPDPAAANGGEANPTANVSDHEKTEQPSTTPPAQMRAAADHISISQASPDTIAVAVERTGEQPQVQLIKLELSSKKSYLDYAGVLIQFLLIVIAIWGYHVAVKPVIQKELLEEDIASKTKELRKLTDKSRTTEAALATSRQELLDAGAAKEKLQLEHNAKLEELEQIEHSLTDIRGRLASKEEDLRRLDAAKSRAEQRRIALIEEIERLNKTRLAAEANLKIQTDLSVDVIGRNHQLLKVIYMQDLATMLKTDFNLAIGKGIEGNLFFVSMAPRLLSSKELSFNELNAMLEKQKMPATRLASSLDPEVKKMLQKGDGHIPFTDTVSLYWFAPDPATFDQTVRMAHLFDNARIAMAKATKLLLGNDDSMQQYLRFIEAIDAELAAHLKTNPPVLQQLDQRIATLIAQYEEQERELNAAMPRKSRERENAISSARAEFGEKLEAIEQDLPEILAQLASELTPKLIDAYADTVIEPITKKNRESPEFQDFIVKQLDEHRESIPDSAWELQCGDTRKVTFTITERATGGFGRNEPLDCLVRSEDGTTCFINCGTVDSTTTVLQAPCEPEFAPKGKLPRACRMTPLASTGVSQ